MNYQVTVIRSQRRSIAVEIRPDLSIYVRAPYRTSEKEIQRFLKEKESWIKEHLLKMQERRKETVKAAQSAGYLSMEELRQLADRAMQVIPGKTAFYAGKLQVSYGRITIRNQKTRWGSCSSKGNLNFNCLLMLAPEEVLDYVIVHELCHRLEMNHSSAFWTRVGNVMPDFQKRRDWLKEHGPELMARMSGNRCEDKNGYAD